MVVRGNISSWRKACNICLVLLLFHRCPWVFFPVNFSFVFIWLGLYIVLCISSHALYLCIIYLECSVSVCISCRVSVSSSIYVPAVILIPECCNNFICALYCIFRGLVDMLHVAYYSFPGFFCFASGAYFYTATFIYFISPWRIEFCRILPLQIVYLVLNCNNGFGTVELGFFCWNLFLSVSVPSTARNQ